MLKQFMNSGSLKSLMLFDAESEAGIAEEKAKLREQLAKGNIVKDAPVVEKKEETEEEGEEEIEEEDEDETSSFAKEINTKLDLAAAYQEIGDKDGARELLDEVAKSGNRRQVAKAQEMLEQLS